MKKNKNALLEAVRNINGLTDMRTVQEIKKRLEYANQTPENLEALRLFWQKTGMNH